MFQDASTGLNGVLPYREAGFWRNKLTDVRETDDFSRHSQIQVSSPKDLPPSAFKVYDKVSEKHRYVPRKWTQEEFEAALPERFTRNARVRKDFQNIFNPDELDSFKESEDVASRESQIIAPNSRTKAEITEKIRNLKEIFEDNGNSNADCKTSGAVVYKSESFRRIATDVSEMDELERCKDSEAKVKVIEKDPLETSYENAEIVEDIPSRNGEKNNCDLETEICCNKVSSFLDSCLRCLLNIEPFAEMANISLQLQRFIESLENPKQSMPEDLEFWGKISERSNCDEVLAGFLETLNIQGTKEEGNLRSLFQGEFCHIKTCDRCTTIVKETEPFLFLNPTTAPGPPSKTDVLDVNFLSSSLDGVWYLTTRQFAIKPGMTFVQLKGELLSSSEFEACEANSIRIGEVKDSRIIRTFNDYDEVATILTFPPTTSIFAWHVLNFTRGFEAGASPFNSTAACYQLYFNCGLCLSDGSDVGLYIHKNCGGMVCRDCLDVITQSYQDWELCPCPICERPMDVDKELCKARMTTMVPQEPHPKSSNLLCQVMFRADKPLVGGSEIFGSPLIATLPRQVSGHHLYRCIGYLLPNTLPMKDRTSFTLHSVDNSGSSCSACSKVSCSGCLVRIDDNVRITRDTNFVVHFEDLAEESMKSFGIPDPSETAASDSRGFFDAILRSCVKASTGSDGMICPKCSSVCKVSSSVAEFPKLLVIHLNRLYAEQGLPETTTIAEVSRFLVLQHNKSSIRNTEGPVYQLTAAVLGVESDENLSFKPFVHSKDAWISFEQSQASEIDPFRQQLTKNSVLFYEPVKHNDPSQNRRVLKMPSFCQSEETRRSYDPGNIIHGKKLATISEETSAASHPMDFRKQTKQRPVHRYSCGRQFEPGELIVETDVELCRRRGRLKPDIYSSQLSLGEITIHPDVSAGMPGNIDGISPIFAQETAATGARSTRETRKLIRAVKREDAYGIVCSLKNGADPCLLIDDVSALHLAAGIKSDQRCSMVAYLLKYSNDVNVATGDGTTPLHVAAAWGHQDALELFLCHGGDAFERTDQDGNSAFDLASKDCSSFLQHFLKTAVDSPGSFLEPSTSSRASLANVKAQRLEDLVRSNVNLPSFVHEDDANRSHLRRRWLERFRSFRNKSSGVLRNIRRLSSVRRRSRIGVMVT